MSKQKRARKLRRKRSSRMTLLAKGLTLDDVILDFFSKDGKKIFKNKRGRLLGVYRLKNSMEQPNVEIKIQFEDDIWNF